MTDRQRRRLVAVLLWSGIILTWVAYLLARSFNISSQVRWEVFVVLTVGTAAILIGRVCIRAIHREHAYTRNVIAGLPDWITVLMAQKVQEAISTRGARTVWSTTYVPERDLEPHKMASMRDLLADQTGDIQGMF